MAARSVEITTERVHVNGHMARPVSAIDDGEYALVPRCTTDLGDRKKVACEPGDMGDQKDPGPRFDRPCDTLDHFAWSRVRRPERDYGVCNPVALNALWPKLRCE